MKRILWGFYAVYIAVSVFFLGLQNVRCDDEGYEVFDINSEKRNNEREKVQENFALVLVPPSVLSVDGKVTQISPVLKECRFYRNIAVRGGGSAMESVESSLILFFDSKKNAHRYYKSLELDDGEEEIDDLPMEKKNILGFANDLENFRLLLLEYKIPRVETARKKAPTDWRTRRKMRKKKERKLKRANKKAKKEKKSFNPYVLLGPNIGIQIPMKVLVGISVIGISICSYFPYLLWRNSVRRREEELARKKLAEKRVRKKQLRKEKLLSKISK